MTNELLDSIDFNELNKYLPEYLLTDFNNRSGIEHYRLLNYLAKDLNLVYDIGSYRGSSAIALSSAKKVKSFDIENQIQCDSPNNVTFSNKDYLTKDILKADLILIDIDHSGANEKIILNYLQDNNYKGLVLLDDIHYFSGLQILWNQVDQRKEDLTSLGHYTGTGLIYFE